MMLLSRSFVLFTLCIATVALGCVEGVRLPRAHSVPIDATEPTSSQPRGKPVSDPDQQREWSTKNHARHVRRSIVTDILHKLRSPSGHIQPELQKGILCAGCVLVTGIIEQLTQVHNHTVAVEMEEFCKLFPGKFKDVCDSLVLAFGPTIIDMFDDHQTPDVICDELKLCTNPECRLFPAPTRSPSREYVQPQSFARPEENPIEWLIQLLTNVFNNHVPLMDLDKDKFGTEFTFRGSAWRGYDCDDLAGDIYPGRQQSTYPPTVDHDCNGIYGVDNVTGKSYEDLYCSGTKRYGYLLLGDSAGAHFHIPPSYATATEIKPGVYDNLLDILTDEFDWPFMSAATGYENSTWKGAPQGQVSSVYMWMRSKNQCSHRDYQSLSVNGARSSAMASHIIQGLARNSSYDHPLLVSYALIGNDVCNSHPGMGHMTTPAEFKTNVLAAMNYLNDTIPAGSHVYFMGLVDGRILYDTMHARIHPIGSTNNDVTYKILYDYLNCLSISPCRGWMNSNETFRNETTQRAFELNAVYKEIISTTKFANFDMTYYDCPMPAIVKEWEAKGGQAYELIEPMDGFHPSQTANFLLANYMTQLIEKTAPGIVPPTNPNNAKISQTFGDQGGYTGNN